MFSTDLPVDAPDLDIWNFARENGLPLILTYDEDFRNLAERFGPHLKSSYSVFTIKKLRT